MFFFHQLILVTIVTLTCNNWYCINWLFIV